MLHPDSEGFASAARSAAFASAAGDTIGMRQAAIALSTQLIFLNPIG
jgi:hypothetical protein